jgi:hypothetical protein
MITSISLKKLKINCLPVKKWLSWWVESDSETKQYWDYWRIVVSLVCIVRNTRGIAKLPQRKWKFVIFCRSRRAQKTKKSQPSQARLPAEKTIHADHFFSLAPKVLLRKRKLFTNSCKTGNLDFWFSVERDWWIILSRTTRQSRQYS